MKRTDFGILLAVMGLTLLLCAPAFGRTEAGAAVAFIGAALGLLAVRYV